MSSKTTNLLLPGLALVLSCQIIFAAPANAQNYFHSVQKTASEPFTRPTNQAMPKVKTVGTNLKAFGVPFKTNANDDSFIEVQLYLSRDMGQTWKFYARQSTDQTDFPFQADQDGEYWFALKTLDRDRRLVPEGDPQAELKIVVDTVQPDLDFRIESDAAGRVVCRWKATDKNLTPDSFQMLYQPVDEIGKIKDWIRVPVELNGKSRVGVYADQIAWWPETTERQLNVAIEIRDLAGNVAQVQRQIMVPQTAWRHRSESIAQITDSPTSGLPNTVQPESQFSAPSGGFTTPPNDTNTAPDKSANGSNPYPPNVVCENGVCRKVPAQLTGSATGQLGPPSPNADPQAPPHPQLSQNALPTNRPGSIVWESEPQKRFSPTRSSVGTTIGSSKRLDPSLAPIANPMQREAKPVTDVPSNPATMQHVGDQVIGESSTMGRTNQYRGLNSRERAALPPPTLLPGENGNRDSIAANSQTGAGQWTQPSPSEGGGFSNAGFANRPPGHPQSQSPSPATKSVVESTARSLPDDMQAPIQIIGTQRFRLDYGIDAIDPSGVARVDLWMTRDGRNWTAWGSDPDNQSPFPVEVQQEGRYGFRIVVHSRDGLTGQGPSTGDDADMWVLVDTQAPLTHISSVPYGRGDEAGRLVINYSVSDTNLTVRPIALAYAATSEGPWNPIGEGLRNEGRYVWKPTSNVPDQIFLRIDALDKAGNVGVHVLSQAIDVSGLVPRGTIRGVSPVGR